MLIKNISLLYGVELTYIQNTNVRISGKNIEQIGVKITPKKNEIVLDCEGILMMPGLINSHTHIGDSIAKDIGIDSDVEEKIHPVSGFKQKVLKNSTKSHLTSFIKNSCISMMKKGITSFIDFREGGLDGVSLLKNSSTDIPIRSIILGRAEYYQDVQSIKKNTPIPPYHIQHIQNLLMNCDGLGISGPNEFSNSALTSFAKTTKIRAIHSAETEESNQISKKITGKTETQRALLVKPNFLVHMTYASKKDLAMAVRNKASIVVCPRANGSLAEGIPDVDLMLEAGCNVAIGTDNVMINSPDVFREMDYLWKVSMGMKKKRLEAKDILKMATTNASNILGKKIGVVQNNKIADCIFIEKHSIDLEPMHNPHASIVQRASENTIRAVMYEGEIVYGKI
ncbi:Amidohydrolase family protein [Nitrosotalea sinensis]|jgi:cytosine/adenosine deaminase-related metal-dependent hydrolase|uniref:Amidohydrolase family protein n=1 Tax=Nitrosotalea sinensis TaxID=1499975 RepID=A0A2H1EF90_9ARCH|nr:amidohydrolase family protein [Candidatus Nitrosotalea sinensis]SHO44024.1 Amidohydrolase family protein [Candidatus Nitrosotalea sinensis]